MGKIFTNNGTKHAIKSFALICAGTNLRSAFGFLHHKNGRKCKEQGIRTGLKSLSCNKQRGKLAYNGIDVESMQIPLFSGSISAKFVCIAVGEPPFLACN